MAKSRLIGDYPVIGIRPTIDGRRGKIKVRESLEDQTMNMAKSAAKQIFVAGCPTQLHSLTCNPSRSCQVAPTR